MIYTVISDYKKLLPEILTEEGEIASPFSLLPDKLKEYIKKPKNEEARMARLGGYLLLFHVTRFLFGELDFEIEFNDFGKPYFKNESMKQINFNISNKSGLCALTLSDEPCDVGIDIEEKTDEQTADRIVKRLPDFGITKKKLEPVYLFGGFSSFGDCMFAEIPSSSLHKGCPEADFTDKWTLFEALIKCDGRGFAAFTELERLSEISASETVRITYRGKSFSVTTAIK